MRTQDLSFRIAIAMALLGAAPAVALDQNSLRAMKTGSNSVRLTWTDLDPTGFCVLRDATPAPVTQLAPTLDLFYDDLAADGGLLYYAVDEPGDGSCGGDCVDNTDCPPAEYCHHTLGACAGLGSCALQPTACPPSWDPVCGCDGLTYGNECEAAAAGQAVAARGECSVVGCIDNFECSAAEFCQKAAGDCLGVGECVAQPSVCLAVWIPVCGCDGQTYSNAGCAAVAGVSVAYDGEC